MNAKQELQNIHNQIEEQLSELTDGQRSNWYTLNPYYGWRKAFQLVHKYPKMSLIQVQKLVKESMNG